VTSNTNKSEFIIIIKILQIHCEHNMRLSNLYRGPQVTVDRWTHHLCVVAHTLPSLYSWFRYNCIRSSHTNDHQAFTKALVVSLLVTYITDPNLSRYYYNYKHSGFQDLVHGWQLWYTFKAATWLFMHELYIGAVTKVSLKKKWTS